MNAEKTLLVIKIGGSTLGSHDTTLEDIVYLQGQGVSQVVVHGGGELVTQWMGKQGIEAQFVRGLRVTDAQSLDVVCAVLAGLVNKQLVSAINALGGKAVGVSGVDGNLIKAVVRDPELGFVGRIVDIDLTLVRLLVDAGYVPVVSPLGIMAGPFGDGAQMLNINADTVAGEIAARLASAQLIFLTDVEGVLDGSGKLISTLGPGEATELIVGGTASGGMIPKLEACLRAVTSGRHARIIDGRAAHMLLESMDKDGLGTTVRHD